MTESIQKIGFNQRIQLEWLERTAGLVLVGGSKLEIKAALHDLLASQLPAGSLAGRTTADRIISILLKTWVAVPQNLVGLRDDGIALFKRLPAEDHLILHWGMSLAVYPFFGLVTETTGRLLRLQETVATDLVLRRVKEQLGDRETIDRPVQRVLRSFIDWGVLEESTKKTIKSCSLKPVKDPDLIAWLIEAILLFSRTDTRPLAALTHSPALFPFSVGFFNSNDLSSNPRLQTLRQGLDEVLVTHIS